MNHFSEVWKLIRPYQWIKNGFVLTGLLFSQEWHHFPLLVKVFLTVLAFCLISSSVYVVNDIVDRENDRHHPKKKNRPLAAGTVTISFAVSIVLIFVAISLGLGFFVSPMVLAILLGYFLLNMAYSYRLKHVVILDVFCIATGFMLRILAGTVGVGIPPSKWLLLCGLMITLFLGFAKRRAEILALHPEKKKEHRQVLASYGPVLLDEIIAICATGVIITYSLYTMSPETVRAHHTESLIATVPFVIYALFRYIFLLHHCQGGGEPSRDLLKDRHIVASVIGWLLMTFWIFMRKNGL